MKCRAGIRVPGANTSVCVYTRVCVCVTPCFVNTIYQEVKVA